MPMTPTTLRPGLLVSLKTNIKGNVSYQTKDIEPDHLTGDGERRARWETERTIADAEEHALAIKARGKARSLVTAVCAQSAFGLLCPQSNESLLDSAITEGRKIVDAFNTTATLTRISFYVIIGRVEQDDVEAVRAINSEVRDLMAEMQIGVENCDVTAIRNAANKARSLGQMLQPEAAGKIKEAIEAARSAARRIVAAGETATQIVDREALRKLETARTAFLDINIPETTAPAMPEEEGRAIDFDPPPNIDLATSTPVPTLEVE